jgi:hypothetical protein
VPTIPADWFKIVSTVSGVSTTSFDEVKQSNFKTSLASLIAADPGNMIMLVENGDEGSVRVNCAVAVTASSAAEASEVLNGAGFREQFGIALEAQGITLAGSVDVHQIEDDTEMSSFDSLFGRNAPLVLAGDAGDAGDPGDPGDAGISVLQQAKDEKIASIRTPQQQPQQQQQQLQSFSFIGAAAGVTCFVLVGVLVAKRRYTNSETRGSGQAALSGRTPAAAAAL